MTLALRALVAWTVLVAGAAAQDRLSLEQASFQPSVQADRPIPTWWDVQIAGSALVEGQFEFQLFHEENLLTAVTTDAYALAPPSQRIRVMFPPVEDEMRVQQLRVVASFRNAQQVQFLGQHLFRVALPNQRTFMTLVPTARTASRNSAVRKAILERLQLESLGSDLGDTVKTVLTSLDPPDVPQDPLGYCAYDLVVLFGDEFRQLKPPQLDGLLAWVRAGGAVYVEPTSVLERWHLEFLKKLVDPRGSEVALFPGDDGRLLPDAIPEPGQPFLVRLGLGRIVVRIASPDAVPDVDAPAWRIASAFLWRLEQSQQRELQTEVAPALFRESVWNYDPSVPTPYYQQVNLLQRVPDLNTDLITMLMPRGVRMVPLSLLAVLLGVFVVWIGVFDYSVLGWLRLRKYTWITFPVATLSVTALTVWISNQYMSSGDSRRALIIHDLDAGSVVRTNRFEMLFQSTARVAESPLQKTLFTPLKTMTVELNPYDQSSARLMYTGIRQQASAQLSGRVPTDFTARQELAKWTPQLNRLFAIPVAQLPDPHDWTALTREATRARPQPGFVPQALINEVIRQFGGEARVMILGPQGIVAAAGDWHGLIKTTRPWSDPYRYSGGNVGGPEVQRWITYYSVAPNIGVHRLTPQLGPTGGSSLEDLTVLDPSDSDRGLLIIVVPEGDNLVAYRTPLEFGSTD